MLIQPYLFFDGRGEQAAEFYRDALGAEIEMLMRFRDAPDPPPADMVPADWGDKVMHASLRIGELRLMLSDGCSGEDTKPSGFALSLDVADADTVDRTLAALCADGGEITMPAGETFWSKRFGMGRDRFGVQWMVGVSD